MRQGKWVWPLVLPFVFLVGIAAGWFVNAPDGAHEARRSSTQGRTRLNRAIRQTEHEIEAARGGRPEAGKRSGTSQTLTQDDRNAMVGLTIAVDPGHNGGNSSHPNEIRRPVPASNDGSTKPCNTTGTQTNDGKLTEAQFNFDVGSQLKRDLQAAAAKVVMTRNSNDGVGPCVDERAEISNRAAATVLISIHADGNNSSGASGFHVIHALPDKQVDSSFARPSSLLAQDIRNALVSAGVPFANYVGENGIEARDDLADLNLARMPAVLVKLGNMRSVEEARRLENPNYRSRLASALMAGLSQFFEANPIYKPDQ